MILISSIIKEFKGAFLKQYHDSILPSHHRALNAMSACREENGLHMLAQCTDHDCGKQIYIPHSCGHRSCPHCQNHESQAWIENEQAKILPATYYLITFTIPRRMAGLVLAHQRKFYSLMFACVQAVLKEFTANDRKLGGNAGFTAVLHTHSRTLDFHPHIHVLMPAASIDMENRLWRVKDGKYIFSHKALAKVFRAKILQAVNENGMVIPSGCPKKWVVHCKNVGSGEKAVTYLGRYLYRGVIQERDILQCKNGMVTFRYHHAKTGCYRTRTVTGEKFLQLLMLHVLPRGFRRTRSYGFLHPCSKKMIQILQAVLRFNPFGKAAGARKKRPSIQCPACGKPMHIIGVMIPTPEQRSRPAYNLPLRIREEAVM